MRWRKPDVEFVVRAGQSVTAAEAMGKHQTFVALAMKHDVRVVRVDGANMVVAGRPKKMARFEIECNLLSHAGAI